MITITTSNVNGIRAAKRKGIETWAGEHAPDIWCMQEVRAPQDELNPIFGEFGFEYATAGKIADQSELTAMNEVCRVKGRAGVGLLTDLPVTARRYGLSGLDEDVDSGRWIEADVTTPQGYGITVACVYVHAGNSDDPVKMAQKYRFLDTMLTRMGELRDEASRGGRQAVKSGHLFLRRSLPFFPSFGVQAVSLRPHLPERLRHACGKTPLTPHVSPQGVRPFPVARQGALRLIPMLHKRAGCMMSALQRSRDTLAHRVQKPRRFARAQNASLSIIDGTAGRNTGHQPFLASFLPAGAQAVPLLHVGKETPIKIFRPLRIPH